MMYGPGWKIPPFVQKYDRNKLEHKLFNLRVQSSLKKSLKCLFERGLKGGVTHGNTTKNTPILSRGDRL
jgi:hypothetical protein